MEFGISGRNSPMLSEDDRRAVRGSSSDSYDMFKKAVRSDKCHRCRRAVYQAERITVDRLIYHKGCFRCIECGVVLTLSTAAVSSHGERGKKEVFCKTHAPKVVKHGMDNESIGIRNAMNAQQISSYRGFNNHIRIQDTTDWEYDPYALEFSHAKYLNDRNRKKKPPQPEVPLDQQDTETYNELTDKLLNGEIDRDSVKTIASCLEDHFAGKSPYPVSREAGDSLGDYDYVPSNGQGYGDQGNQSAFIDDDCHYETLRIRAGADNRKNLDDKMMHMIQTLTARDRAKFRMFMQELYGPDFDRMQPGGDQEALVNNSERHYAKPYGRRGSGADLSQYDPLDASQPPFLAEMLAQQATISSPDGTLRTRPSTSSTGAHAIPEEAKKDKIFIAQNELELKQREEENKIFKDFENRRESEIKRLEREIRGDLEHAVKNLLKEMDRGYFTGDFNKEKYQIEEHFKTLKQDRLQDLLSDLSAQERDRLSGMIDKQSSEMLQLISKKHKSMVPPPRPPTTKKAELIANSASFENVDHQAIEVASWDQNSFTELVFWLVRSCKNEVEKARAIFRWITVKDLNKMLFFGNIDPSSPFFLLRGIKYGLESYHDLFKRLCSYAGLHCHVIQGYSKSFGYKPGMPIADERFRNQWTVVYVDGSWRFVDTHWGARRINSGLRGGGGGGGEGSSRSDPSRGSYAGMGAEDDAAKSQECSYEYDDFYFLTDPEDFIHQHYPDDPNWQLLEEPITMEDFVQMPLLKSHFFHYGLSLRSHQSAMVSTDTGKVDIVLGCETPDRLSFTTRLQSEGEILDRFAIHHIVDNKIIFNVNIPRRGDHTLTIFANDSRSSSEVYNSICIFGIRCDYIEPDSKFRFPLLPLGVGPLPAASALGLELESHQEPFIESRGELVIDLGFEKPVKVNHKLLCGNYDYHDDNFDRFAFQQYREKMAVSYVIRFPEQGYYAFSVYAAELEDSNPTMDCLYSYLIFCPKQPECPPKVSPKALTRWMKCRLHEPIYGDLKLNKNIKFKVEVPGAKKVAVIIKGKWYYLKSTNRVIWEGAVFTGKDLDMAYVFANFDGLNFLPLLEYTLMR